MILFFFLSDRHWSLRVLCVHVFSYILMSFWNENEKKKQKSHAQKNTHCPYKRMDWTAVNKEPSEKRCKQTTNRIGTVCLFVYAISSFQSMMSTNNGVEENPYQKIGLLIKKYYTEKTQPSCRQNIKQKKEISEIQWINHGIRLLCSVVSVRDIVTNNKRTWLPTEWTTEKRKNIYSFTVRRSPFTDTISGCFEANPLFSNGQKTHHFGLQLRYTSLSKFCIFGDCWTRFLSFLLIVVNCFRNPS